MLGYPRAPPPAGDAPKSLPHVPCAAKSSRLSFLLRRTRLLDLHPTRGLEHLELALREQVLERVPVDDLQPVVLPVRELDSLRPLHEAGLETLPLRDLDRPFDADRFHRHSVPSRPGRDERPGQARIAHDSI